MIRHRSLAWTSRHLATDSNNNTIDYKNSKWLKHYGIGKESLNEADPS